jgi:hypothetical protein
MTDTGAAPTKEQLIARYKTILRELIDKRPSGTRLKIAAAIGRHKSFVSQIVSPAYPMPLPGTHIPTILSICHFSDDERGRFLEAYRAAHPNQFAKLGTGPEGGAGPKQIRIELPAFDDAGRQREVEATIRDLAKRIIALALDK